MMQKAFPEVPPSRKARATARQAQTNSELEHMRDMLACTVHELRTPILGIRALAEELLLETDPSVDPRVGAIDEICENMLTLIEDLLLFEKANSGRISIRRDRIDLDRLLHSIRTHMAPMARRKGLALAVDMGTDFPGIIRSDGFRLRQIVQNLVANALKFTREGDVAIRVRRLERDLRIEVIDTGSGIAPEQMDKLFRRFSQVGPMETRSAGSGLGLAICDQLARMIGGSVGVRSTLGKGSTFWIDLPGVVVEGPKRGAPVRRRRGLSLPLETQRAPRSILIVEDDPISLQVLCRILLQRGQTVATASTVSEALAVCSAVPIEVVVSDLELPDDTGFSLARQLAQARSGGGPRLLLAMSAHVTEEKCQLGAEAGFDRVLDKLPGALSLAEHILSAADKLS